MNIIIAEDSAAVRRLPVRRPATISGMGVVGEVCGQNQTLASNQWTQPDAMLVGLALAAGSSLAMVATLREGGHAGRVAVVTAQLATNDDAFYTKASGLEALFDELARQLPLTIGSLEDKPCALLRDGLTALYNETSLYECSDQALRASRDRVDVAVHVQRV